MEPEKHEDDRTPLDKDQGFTMQFSIDVVDVSYPDAVAERVEQMMRLGAHGRFKEAREISDSELAPYSYMFPVAAERMRLLLDQAAFEDLIKLAHALDTSNFTQTERMVVELMLSIARIAVSTEDNMELAELNWLSTELDDALECLSRHLNDLSEEEEAEHVSDIP